MWIFTVILDCFVFYFQFRLLTENCNCYNFRHMFVACALILLWHLKLFSEQGITIYRSSDCYLLFELLLLQSWLLLLMQLLLILERLPVFRCHVLFWVFPEIRIMCVWSWYFKKRKSHMNLTITYRIRFIKNCYLYKSALNIQILYF